MKHHILYTSPETAFDAQRLKEELAKKLPLPDENRRHVIHKRSVDARKSPARVRLDVSVENQEEHKSDVWRKDRLQHVNNQPEVIIVGAGPAGLFAALQAIELGVKPVIIERGKDVRSRRRDLAAINKTHEVNPESNYCFGEGGAGTYSDGKLYTRSKKRGDIKRILEIFYHFGAPEEILFDAHPHIGTNKLPRIIQEIRDCIIACGGEVHFDSKVTDLILSHDTIEGVVVNGDTRIKGKAVLLATGHSARDIFELLAKKEVDIQAKPFALGVRVEHPQELIDALQYKQKDRGMLPAAAYALKAQAQYKAAQCGVFSFCMCPGGFIVPAATSPGEIVVNGMSPSRRNSRYANSGIVVTVDESDFAPYAKHGELRGMYYQSAIEQKACEMAGGTQTAPSQRLTDFVKGCTSADLPYCSYQPGLQSVPLASVLPTKVSKSLRQGFQHFGRQMKGYLTNEAVLVGVESRSSSPVNIPRDTETFEHIRIKKLYPCGEGAGYAGGIVSAAMDGERCMKAIIAAYVQEV